MMLYALLQLIYKGFTVRKVSPAHTDDSLNPNLDDPVY